MRAVVQRVSEASVTVKGDVVGQVGRGLLVLACAMHGDTAEDVEYLARKIVDLRLFEGVTGKFDSSLRDVGGSVLLVSQFTLAGKTRKGRRPDFSEAAAPAEAEPLCEALAAAVRAHDVAVATGRFGARMEVALINEGPVTLWLDSRDRR